MSSRFVLLLASLSGLAARVIDASDLERDHIERVGLAVLSAGGDEDDVAITVEQLLEDAVHWPDLVVSPFGELVEEMEDPILRGLSRRIARALVRGWKRLDTDKRIARIEALTRASK